MFDQNYIENYKDFMARTYYIYIYTHVLIYTLGVE
jgi:hypothetical protein